MVPCQQSRIEWDYVHTFNSLSKLYKLIKSHPIAADKSFWLPPLKVQARINKLANVRCMAIHHGSIASAGDRSFVVYHVYEHCGGD